MPSKHVHVEQRYEFAAEFCHVELVESKIQQGYKRIKPLQDQRVLKMFVSFPFPQVEGDRVVCHIENHNDQRLDGDGNQSVICVSVQQPPGLRKIDQVRNMMRFKNCIDVIVISSK